MAWEQGFRCILASWSFRGFRLRYTPTYLKPSMWYLFEAPNASNPSKNYIEGFWYWVGCRTLQGVLGVKKYQSRERSMSSGIMSQKAVVYSWLPMTMRVTICFPPLGKIV